MIPSLLAPDTEAEALDYLLCIMISSVEASDFDLDRCERECANALALGDQAALGRLQRLGLYRAMLEGMDG